MPRRPVGSRRGSGEIVCFEKFPLRRSVLGSARMSGILGLLENMLSPRQVVKKRAVSDYFALPLLSFVNRGEGGKTITTIDNHMYLTIKLAVILRVDSVPMHESKLLLVVLSAD